MPLTPQRFFALMLSLIALLCAGIGIAVLGMRSSEQDSPELRKEVELAASHARDMMEQLNVLKARVRHLEQENQRLLNQAAEAARATRAQPAPAPTPADPFQEEPPSPDNPLVASHPGADAFFDSLTALLGGQTNGVADAANVFTGKPSRALLGFIRAAGLQQAREQARTRSVELASRLGLSDAQRTALEEALARQQETQVDDLQHLMEAVEADGPFDAAGLTNQVAEVDALRGILDPAQLQAYEAWQAAETRSNREAFALESLSSMQRSLPDLNQEQKDRLYQHYLARAEALPSGDVTAFGLPLGLLAGANREQEEEAFRGILTPAQFDSWKARSEPGEIRSFSTLPGGGRAISVQSFKIDTKVSEPVP